MTKSASDDPLPAFIILSWLAFLIPAAYVSVHGPDILADGILLVADLFGRPLLWHTTLLEVVRDVSAVLLVLISAALFSGYLLFGFAPPAVGSRAGTYVGAFAFCTLSGLIFPFAAWVWGGAWHSRMEAGLFPLLAWVLYVLRTVDSDRVLRRPFVLFFRRFDSFADLSILPSLLRLTPSGVPVVVLVSGTENEVGYWDPVKLMTFGLRATLPLGGRPVFLRGGENWERVMESLVDHSTVVVLDQTEKSDAMTTESEAVRHRGRPLILLTEASGASDTRTIRSDIGDDIEIAYRRGSLALPAIMVVLILAMTIYGAELPRQLREKAAEGDLWGGLFGAAIMLGFVSVVAGGLLLRRSLTRPVRRELADALRERLVPSTQGNDS